MTLQQFLKGALMAIISVLVVAFTQVPVDYSLMIVTVIATVLAYSGKNLISVLHSDSDMGRLSLINLISALLVAFATAITESIAFVIVDHKIAWPILGKIVLSTTLTYLGATLLTPPNVKSKKLL